MITESVQIVMTNFTEFVTSSGCYPIHLVHYEFLSEIVDGRSKYTYLLSRFHVYPIISFIFLSLYTLTSLLLRYFIFKFFQQS